MESHGTLDSARKTILFAWELGAGLGHMLPMLPLAEDLAKAGYRVFVAMRNLCGAGSLYSQAGVRFLPAAFKTEGRNPFPRGATYAHLLANVGWCDDAGLFGVACAWRNRYQLLKPDLLVLDHSPTALLAASGLPVRKALMGLGFFCPPDVAPLPALRPGADPQRLHDDECKVLAHANAVLARWKQPPLPHLGRLFAEVDENFLATFPELDHYGHRQGMRYWGPITGAGGIAPVWPDRPGKRIYAYLKRSAGVEEVLAELARREQPTLVFAMGIDAAVRRRFESPHMRFETRPLDMSAVAREADLAVLNANHGTMCELLLRGRPVLMLPLYLEQRVLAGRVAALGAGEMSSATKGCAAEFGRKLDAMLLEDRYARAAAAFASRHADFDPRRGRREMLRRALELVDGPAARQPAASLATLSAGLCRVVQFGF